MKNVKYDWLIVNRYRFKHHIRKKIYLQDNGLCVKNIPVINNIHDE